MIRVLFLALSMLACALPGVARAEDGYDLWLRYPPIEGDARAPYAAAATAVVEPAKSPTLDAAARELQRGIGGMLGSAPNIVPSVDRDGAIVIGTPRTARLIATLGLDLSKLGDEGYLIRSITIDGHKATVIAANSDTGVLYGAFRLLKLMQTRQPLTGLNLADAPKLQIRVLNHWDNLNRYVERGYAGQSIWDWQKLPRYVDPRIIDYARANASIGINGTVLNNVNASPDILRPEFLAKVKALADTLRPYGIRVYLSANFASPMQVGELKTADPLDPAVRAWWQAKVDEVYGYVPDFGGFLVKASSEGQPGPDDFGRTQADGANMLADALAPHHGVVMWRAFVYSQHDNEDRAKQAYTTFKPLDGKFRDNVIVQVKNGAIDFQPREPFHPLFGAMPKTPLMLEVQITKEYLGFATHLVYLGPLWTEALDADTYRPRKGTSVADVIETQVRPGAPTGMAGVANIGSDRNWTGSQFDQANWYAFGRLAWNPQGDAGEIATDWIRMTWGNDPQIVSTVRTMMLESREAVVDYMTPLGLAHQMATGHHYGPGPWVHDLARPEWNPVYYNKADARGIGFDRTGKGSDAVSQYAPEVARMFDDVKTTPEKFLLWFHHLPWSYRMKDGDSLWDSLVDHYDRGVATVADMQRDWATLSARVDPRRFAEVTDFLEIQHDEAEWWRNASVAYFQSKSQLPLPAGHAEPPHDLRYYEAIKTPYAPGN